MPAPLRGTVAPGATAVISSVMMFMLSLLALDEDISARSRSLHVRNREDDLIQRLKRRAARHGRSAEAEHHEILGQALPTEGEPSFADLARQIRAVSAAPSRSASEDLFREGRDEW